VLIPVANVGLTVLIPVANVGLTVLIPVANVGLTVLIPVANVGLTVLIPVARLGLNLFSHAELPRVPRLIPTTSRQKGSSCPKPACLYIGFQSQDYRKILTSSQPEYMYMFQWDTNKIIV
jgi:hypothetical protein